MVAELTAVSEEDVGEEVVEAEDADVVAAEAAVVEDAVLCSTSKIR